MRRTRTGPATLPQASQGNAGHQRATQGIRAHKYQVTDYEYIANTAQRTINGYTVPMTLHLDHGKTLGDVRQAVNAGFTSTMIDGAALPFEENIRLSRQAVDFCHANGVPVEAELGAISGKEDDHVSEADCKTNPDEVAEFIGRTGCDLLAVSIGNVHDIEDTPRIDLDHLAKIAAVSLCPLVLHGGSGIAYDTIAAMKQYNMVKINIASDLRQAFIRAVAAAHDANPNKANLAKVLMDARTAVTKVAKKARLAMNGLPYEK